MWQQPRTISKYLGSNKNHRINKRRIKFKGILNRYARIRYRDFSFITNFTIHYVYIIFRENNSASLSTFAILYAYTTNIMNRHKMNIIMKIMNKLPQRNERSKTLTTMSWCFLEVLFSIHPQLKYTTL